MSTIMTYILYTLQNFILKIILSLHLLIFNFISTADMIFYITDHKIHCVEKAKKSLEKLVVWIQLFA